MSVTATFNCPFRGSVDNNALPWLLCPKFFGITVLLSPNNAWNKDNVVLVQCIKIILMQYNYFPLITKFYCSLICLVIIPSRHTLSAPNTGEYLDRPSLPEKYSIFAKWFTLILASCLYSTTSNLSISHIYYGSNSALLRYQTLKPRLVDETRARTPIQRAYPLTKCPENEHFV